MPSPYKLAFYVLPFVLSLSSLIYELSIAKTLILLLHGAKFWESLCLGVFLAGVGLGIFAKEKIAFSGKRFSCLEVALALVGPLGLLGIYLAHLAIRLYVGEFRLLPDSPHEWARPLFGFGALSLVVPLTIGFLSGLELSWVLSWWQTKAETKYAAHWGWLLGAYHFGALAGSLVMVWLHDLPAMALVLGASLINLGVAQMLWRGWWVVWGAGVWLLCAGAFPWVENVWLKGFYYDRVSFEVDSEGAHFQGGRYWNKIESFLKQSDALPDVQTHRSFYQTLHVVHEPESRGFKVPHFAVYLNLEPQFYTRTEASYHKTMVESAKALSPAMGSGNLLVIGGGDGLLLREILGMDNLSQRFRVTLVELDPMVLRLAQEGFWKKLTHSSLSSSQVRVVVQDGFSWLRSESEVFEGAFLDLPYPADEDELRLYSYEFYSRLWKRLKPGAFVVLDAPVGLAHQAENEVILRNTLQNAGFEHIRVMWRDNEGFISGVRGSTRPDGPFVGRYNSVFKPARLR